jgi:hypothetical protein
MCAFTGLEYWRGLRQRDATCGGRQYPRAVPAKH